MGVLVCSGPVGLDRSDSFNRGGGRVRGEGLAGVWFLGFGIMGGGGCLGRGGGACFLMILSRMLLSFMAERKMS